MIHTTQPDLEAQLAKRQRQLARCDDSYLQSTLRAEIRVLQKRLAAIRKQALERSDAADHALLQQAERAPYGPVR